jgi:hypothetical protein
MAAAGLQHLPQPYTFDQDEAKKFLAKYPGLAAEADLAVLLQYGLKVLLYQPHFTTKSKPPPTPLAQVRCCAGCCVWMRHMQCGPSLCV